ncbi:hypothetical protein [Kitasatospora phosalacinea]|uniref:hypothetical protein n=1 Tax=Kitasatospora phosalacinea TaxID=2065 RepID=UPI00131D6B14|nr:hypothetical protein [Kitasatospora phosalacinea]
MLGPVLELGPADRASLLDALDALDALEVWLDCEGSTACAPWSTWPWSWRRADSYRGPGDGRAAAAAAA